MFGYPFHYLSKIRLLRNNVENFLKDGIPKIGPVLAILYENLIITFIFNYCVYAFSSTHSFTTAHLSSNSFPVSIASYFISFTLSLVVPIYMLQARFCSLLYTNVYGTSHNYENAFNDFTSLPSAFFNAAVAAILWPSLTLLKFNFYRYMPYTCNTCSKSKHICICLSVYMCTFIST